MLVSHIQFISKTDNSDSNRVTWWTKVNKQNIKQEDKGPQAFITGISLDNLEK